MTAKKEKTRNLSIKLLLGGLILICIILAVYTFAWKHSKKVLESYFYNGIKTSELEFRTELGYYEKKEDNITYYVPNQKMPAWNNFKLHFMAQSVRANLKTNSETFTIIVLDDDFITLEWNDKRNKSAQIDKNGNLLSASLKSNEQLQYANATADIRKATQTSLELFHNLYKE